ncbi:DUF4145 domain-containing protein [Microbulbifer celer]|uniref:DUF4145 domain-containing protein n=1 Tax=Microbulbifer celer TaxID=435905 RepID=A0ABW3UGA6_9GAMM|nr:DUF4145 domain-containing protein [Microbulbifer celer]UFN56030.1 DUF4145 domain-containing protein [Microbulbifer celer]
MQKYFPPTHLKQEFHCIHCGVFAAQHWRHFTYCVHDHSPIQVRNDLSFCICAHCNEWSYWHEEKMIVPAESPVPPAHQDMPKECIEEYTEAREIVARSPRAASALLRLAVQKLLPVLGESGKNINNDIGALVKKGLPVQVQQALDYCRVVGNNAVHPGEINLNDTPDIAHNLFNMINFIVEDRISRPKHVQSLYEKLPEGARSAIERRDEESA